MEGHNFRADHNQSHVAQQSRRDRLRIHQQHLEDMPINNLERFSVFPETSSSDQFAHLRNVRCANLLYEPTVNYCPEMINFSTNASNSLSAAHRVAMARPTLGSMDRSCDWMVNCASGWLGSSDQSNQNHNLSGGELLSTTSTIMSTMSGSMQCANKTSFSGYQDVQSSLNNPGNEISSDQGIRKQCERMHYASPVFQNNLQDVVTIASTGPRHGSWPAGGNELALLPAYGNQLFDESGSGWSHRSIQNYSHQNGGELGVIARSGDEELSNVVSDRITQGLSLTLSSNPSSQPQVFQFGEGYQPEDLPLRVSDQLPKDRQELNNSDHQCSIIPKQSIISRGSYGKSVKNVAGSYAFAHPGTGPLGPFTGYATILKSSKFLKPAQQLLDEFCSSSSPKLGKTCENPEGVSEKVSISADAFNASDQALVRNKGGSSAASSSTLYSSNDISAGEGGIGDRPSESCQPEYQQKKAKLIYMHEEVCRRYKQYHQQMQMVVSSFESVAGLSATTPYISLALKTVSRHFRCLRNAISDQLRHIRKALGEEFMSPTTGTSSTKGDTNTLRQKYKEQNFQKHKSAGDNAGFLEPQQHVWRPQRGLPERSVAILRTWLFEHFLHPYPTDTDKHMLATQTGLSRNQVSNWFINARVRVWKPMVEEIHMLETNGLAQTSKNEENFVGEGTSCSNGDQETTNKLGINTPSSKRLEFPGMGSSSDVGGGGVSCEQWSLEKRSRVECQINPSSIDRSFMGFVPYQRGGIEMGGLGAVSLTLGLRHSAENAQQQQQLKQQEDQLQRQFEGHMFHDFVG